MVLPLVLLHGIGSNGESWSQIASSFSPEREVLTWNAPGYGESPPSMIARPTADHYASMLSESLTASNVERCDLVGHSLGALIGARLATREAHRIRHLILSSPAQGYCLDGTNLLPEPLQKRIDNARELGPAGLATLRASNTVSREASEEVVARVTEAMAAVSVEGYVQAVWLLAQGDLRSDLRRLTVPLGFICGGEDRITPIGGVRELAAAHPLVEIRGAGHASYADHPLEYIAALRALLPSDR